MSKTSYLLSLALFHDQQKNNQILHLWMFNIQCFLSGEMFGMKFRDRELPAPPLENNSSVESTKKTSVETTRKTLLETRTSKTETVKKVQAASPQFPRPNGRLSSCLEVWQRTKRFLYIIYFFQVSGEPWYKPVDRKTAEEMVKKGKKDFCKHSHFLLCSSWQEWMLSGARQHPWWSGQPSHPHPLQQRQGLQHQHQAEIRWQGEAKCILKIFL